MSGAKRGFRAITGAETLARTKKVAANAQKTPKMARIRPAVWCSHNDMASARINDIVDGEYDTFTGMLNRRVEIQVVMPQQ